MSEQKIGQMQGRATIVRRDRIEREVREELNKRHGGGGTRKRSRIAIANEDAVLWALKQPAVIKALRDGANVAKTIASKGGVDLLSDLPPDSINRIIRRLKKNGRFPAPSP